MKNVASRLIETLPRTGDTMLLPSFALRRVSSTTGNGVYASADELYKSAVFGRDSLEAAEDVLPIRRGLTKDVLHTMVRLQGKVRNDENEEEPGRIVHEYRTVIVDGKPINQRSMEIFTALSRKWGGNDTELAYYGSVDATPLFLKVLGAYCNQYGDKILDDSVEHKNHENVTVRDAAEQATTWLVEKIATSKSGLLEYQRRNSNGIANQVWKDSEEFYVHETGELANHDQPIASIEVQGLAYDGLMAAAHIFPEKSEYYQETAYALRDKTIALLWQDSRNYFALGIDYDTEGTLRVINTTVANPAALLDSALFDELAPAERQKYVTGLVKKIMSYEFLTNAGIRSRGLSAANLVGKWDYHGSFVSWPKETYDIAKGLHRQGFSKLARELENRILNVVLKHGQYPEFVYVDGWGRIMDSTPAKHSHGNVTLVNSTNNPERIQAWTVSAVLAITTKRLLNVLGRTKKAPPPEQWQVDLENYTLNHIPRVPRHLNPFTLQQHYRKHKYKLQ